MISRALSFLALASLFFGCHSTSEGVRLELLAVIRLDEETLVDREQLPIELDELSLTIEMLELIPCAPTLAAQITEFTRLGRARAYHGGPASPTTYAHKSELDLTKAGVSPFGDASDEESDSGFSPPANEYCAAFIRLGAFSLSGSVGGSSFVADIEHLRLDLSLELGEAGRLDAERREAALRLNIDVNALLALLPLSSGGNALSDRDVLNGAIRESVSIEWRETAEQ